MEDRVKDRKAIRSVGTIRDIINCIKEVAFFVHTFNNYTMVLD